MSETTDWTSERPDLRWVMTLQVRIAPSEDLGECAEGWRSNYPILGGTFEGPGLRGQVLPGGADQFLQRRDGVGELDARYSLLTEEGERINIRNLGLLVLDEEGHRLSDEGVWPLAAERYRCSCSPRFQVAEGRLSWLREHMFIGNVSYPSEDQVQIDCYRLA
jgi:hypothetical protein